MAPGEPGELALSEACQRRRPDQGPEAGMDGVGEGEDGAPRERWALDYGLHSGALDVAGIRPEQAVIDGGREDGPEEPIGLGRGVRMAA